MALAMSVDKGRNLYCSSEAIMLFNSCFILLLRLVWGTVLNTNILIPSHCSLDFRRKSIESKMKFILYEDGCLLLCKHLFNWSGVAFVFETDSAQNGYLGDENIQ